MRHHSEFASLSSRPWGTSMADRPADSADFRLKRTVLAIGTYTNVHITDRIPVRMYRTDHLAEDVMRLRELAEKLLAAADWVEGDGDG